MTSGSLGMGDCRGTSFGEKVESVRPGIKRSTAEDEIATWLQYPLNHSSELFGWLASSQGITKPGRDQGVSVSMEYATARLGASAGARNAEDALALGAGRASGILLSEGAETFNNVRTLMQQAPCLHSSTSPQTGNNDLCPPSPLEICHQNGEAFHVSVQPWRLTSTSVVTDEYPVYKAIHNLPTNFAWSSVSPDSPNQGMERLHLTEEVTTSSALCETSNLMEANRARTGSGAQEQMTQTQGSNYSLITEHQRRDDSFCAARAPHSEPVITALYDACASVRLPPGRKERQWQETCGNLHVEGPDVTLLSCSGGSQTSAEMSAKETSSLEKHKLEDYDCQSKNAEVDSAAMSPPYRRPSKRSRVAESHNLSEKRRRNRINEKLKALQELIPNSSKTDKASILDEAIEYLKALQTQLQMMSSRSCMKVSPMVFPTGMQYMQIGHPMRLGFPLMHAGVGMGVGMGLMDFSHGMDARLVHTLSAPSPHFNVAYPATAPLASPTCSQPNPITEVPSVEFWPLHQSPAQAPQQMYIEPHAQTSIEMHQQGEQLSTPRILMDR